ncbi:hypothetical protein AMS68_001722 [Peltaster fructicola]|uniref:Fanconi-associated nuclease n=1 Tax=Peltaster fructicola TaxID=286661 RepID=A0A6H0XNI9_9PEZI|nr:hypothetical protein AMS68_001722 [Peltaster fructicola]
MVLEDSSASKHNVMSRGIRVPHPKSTKFDEEEFGTPPAKRLKVEPKHTSTKGSIASLTSKLKEVIPDSEDGSDFEDIGRSDIVTDRKTDLEAALPPVLSDKQAIEAYEASRAAGELDLHDRLDQSKWTKGKSSIYVDAFNLALETVLDDESHLFNAAEHAVFQAWRNLDYEAQYLYVRLFLRKSSVWFRISRLGYHSDIADLEKAAKELQAERELPQSDGQEHEHPGESESPESLVFDRQFVFADRSEDCITTLEEASSLLMLDELKAIAKDAKVQGKNKSELLKALRRTSGRQTGLGFASLKRSDTDASNASTVGEDDSRESTPARSRENRDSYYLDKIMAETGPCIRLSTSALKLFERVHLVYYRSTEWTEKSLTTIILARISRWNFPEYIVSRSANIFPSRPLLLEFEASIRTQFRIDNILELNGTPTKEGLQTILDIFEEVYPRWKVLVAEEQQKEDRVYDTGEGAYLRRLSPAWVYTRIIHKGAYVLGKFKDHKREHEVLSTLLAQRLFHAARRGDWYQRKALLEEHYMHLHLPSPASCLDTEAKKKHWKRVALKTCEQGLEDQLTHLIFHHDLQKRTVKLEKALKVPKRQQHEFAHVRLSKPTERTFTGIRIERPPSRRSSEPGISKVDRRGAKTIWLDPALEESADGECSVEHMCLSNYRTLGYKGYHCEGSIIKTLFGYLFHEVLFTYLPNVFQTPYQTCPLDLHSDTFYPARISEVNRRLADIENGGAEGIVQGVWDREHEKKTCIIGLDWNYNINDLIEICQVFPPLALGCVMKVLAQEYAARGGGVPDLFLWKPRTEVEKGEVIFSEVKSENDRLSDTQRMWIDVLSGAGVQVELCHAVASEVRRS